MCMAFLALLLDLRTDSGVHGMIYAERLLDSGPARLTLPWPFLPQQRRLKAKFP